MEAAWWCFFCSMFWIVCFETCGFTLSPPSGSPIKLTPAKIRKLVAIRTGML
jgi:hypothetical protein